MVRIVVNPQQLLSSRYIALEGLNSSLIHHDDKSCHKTAQYNPDSPGPPEYYRANAAPVPAYTPPCPVPGCRKHGRSPHKSPLTPRRLPSRHLKVDGASQQDDYLKVHLLSERTVLKDCVDHMSQKFGIVITQKSLEERWETLGYECTPAAGDRWTHAHHCVAHANLSILTTPSWITSTKSADKDKPTTRSKSSRVPRSRPSNNNEPQPDDKPARKKALKWTTEEHEYFTGLLQAGTVESAIELGFMLNPGPTKSEDGHRAKLREEYGAHLYASLSASGSPSLSSYDDPEKKPGKRLRDEGSSDEESSQAKRRLSFSTIHILCPAA
ncbi:hypothetical protein NM208_g7498 [Fusarium decemcellulare]|uniref:Uncharacterized protein n=1 Tax=Fusarium decemcellulare TaxID=57161 RepID=A0ACC1S938_9HYPO|nr:hypothetical protein NM208_g7498 [Fusarium decemcellulare]